MGTKPQPHGAPLGQAMTAVVSAWMSARNLSLRSLGKAMDVTHYYLAKRLDGDADFNFTDLERLAAAFKVEPAVLFAQADELARSWREAGGEATPDEWITFAIPYVEALEESIPRDYPPERVAHIVIDGHEGWIMSDKTLRGPDDGEH